MWRQSCPQIPSLPNPRAAILNFVKGVWGIYLCFFIFILFKLLQILFQAVALSEKGCHNLKTFVFWEK